MRKTRWTAFLLSLLVMIGANSGAISEGQDHPSLTDQLSLKDVRCSFEHELLPDVFYSDPLSVLGGIDATSIYRSWIQVAQDFGYAESYDESDFSVYRLRNEQDIMMALVILPIPTEAPECYRLYLCYDPTTETAFYFTNEYEDDMDGWGLVGYWTPENDHHTVYILPPLDVSSQEAFTESLQNEVDAIFYLVVSNRTAPLTE